MGLSWIVVGIVTFIYCYYWYGRPKNSPPGPRGIPVLGSIPFLGKHFDRKIYEWSKRYGPVMTVRIGMEDQVFLNNYDVIVKALVKQSTSFSGRPSNEFFDQFTKGHGIVFLDYGEKWKSQRKFGLTTLRLFGAGKKSMESKVLEETECLNNFILSAKGKPFDFSFLLKNATANIICGLTMGKRFDYDDARFQDLMNKFFGQLANPVDSLFFRIFLLAPKLKDIPPFKKYNKKFSENFLNLMKTIEEIIKEHEDTFDNEELRDFIDAFIKEKKKGEDPDFTDFQLLVYIRNLFIAGTETSSSSLSWCLLCCLHYPQVQNKLREEIMNVIGSEGTVSFSKKNEMPYTNAFIQEIFRFRTIIPLAVPHKTNEDVEIDGYFIAKDTTVSANIWAVHNDPELWDEPNKFKPERFLDEKGNFLPSNHMIVFGVGPRYCLGEQLARMEVFMFLVGMIQKFEFLPDPSADQLPDIEDGASGIGFNPIPHKILARPL